MILTSSSLKRLIAATVLLTGCETIEPLGMGVYLHFIPMDVKYAEASQKRISADTCAFTITFKGKESSCHIEEVEDYVRELFPEYTGGSARYEVIYHIMRCTGLEVFDSWHTDISDKFHISSSDWYFPINLEKSCNNLPQMSVMDYVSSQPLLTHSLFFLSTEINNTSNSAETFTVTIHLDDGRSIEKVI